MAERIEAADTPESRGSCVADRLLVPLSPTRQSEIELHRGYRELFCTSLKDRQDYRMIKIIE